MTIYQQKMAEYYNKRVKLRRLDIGDLVLRRVTTATRDSSQRNFAPYGKDPIESSTTLGKTVIT